MVRGRNWGKLAILQVIHLNTTTVIGHGNGRDTSRINRVKEPVVGWIAVTAGEVTAGVIVSLAERIAVGIYNRISGTHSPGRRLASRPVRIARARHETSAQCPAAICSQKHTSESLKSEFNHRYSDKQQIGNKLANASGNSAIPCSDRQTSQAEEIEWAAQSCRPSIRFAEFQHLAPRHLITANCISISRLVPIGNSAFWRRHNTGDSLIVVNHAIKQRVSEQC
jgi:hypothetical protein